MSFLTSSFYRQQILLATGTSGWGASWTTYTRYSHFSTSDFLQPSFTEDLTSSPVPPPGAAEVLSFGPFRRAGRRVPSLHLCPDQWENVSAAKSNPNKQTERGAKEAAQVRNGNFVKSRYVYTIQAKV